MSENPKNIGKKLELTYGGYSGMVFEMPDDKRSDEGLVKAYRLGDLSALDTLLKRYELRLRNFVLNFSWWKDQSFIDDIIEDTFSIIFQEIKKGKFDPKETGSFKKWAYVIAKHQCYKASKNQRRQPKLISERYPEEFPDDLAETRSNTSYEVRSLEKINRRLDKILKLLSPAEQELFRLMSQGKTYKEIQKIPPFNKYSLANLRRKVCDLRKLVSEEAEKWSKR